MFIRKIFSPVRCLSLILLFCVSAVCQQTDRDLYINLFTKGDYDKAVIVLKRITKQNSTDGDAWYYLGLTYLKTGKEKDASKAFEKAINLKPTDAQARTGLAYSYLLRNDRRASDVAREALKLNPKIAEAHYVLGVTALREGLFDVAYERAKKAIEINQQLSVAYFLKSQSLVSSFARQGGTVLPSFSARGEMLKEATADLEKYLALTPNSKDKDFYNEYLESLRFYAEYYQRPENQKPISFDKSTPTDSTKTPLIITSKPRPNYTDSARSNNISGIVRLLVGFAADGTVKHIMVIKSVGYGLDEQAVAAARKIRFEPVKENGKPVSVVKQVEYSFMIY